MPDAIVEVYEEAFQLYLHVKNAGGVDKDSAVRMEPGTYTQEAWTELKAAGVLQNASARSGRPGVDLYVDPAFKGRVRSKGPRPTKASRKNRLRQVPTSGATTFEHLAEFAGQAAITISKLTAERSTEAAARVKEAQKAVGTAAAGDLPAAMKQLEAALEDQGRVDAAVRVEALVAIKPPRTHPSWALWSVLTKH